MFDSDKQGPVPGTETTISGLKPLTIYNFTVIVLNSVSNIVGASTPVSISIETGPQSKSN